MSAGMLPRLKVVADKDRVEADRLGQTRELQQLARPELFGRRLVSELQQHTLLPKKHKTTSGSATAILSSRRNLPLAGNRGFGPVAAIDCGFLRYDEAVVLHVLCGSVRSALNLGE